MFTFCQPRIASVIFFIGLACLTRAVAVDCPNPVTVWHEFYEGYGSGAGAPAVAQDGSIILAGRFLGTVDFDPGLDEDFRTSVSSDGDMFISKLDPAGLYQGTRTVPIDMTGWPISVDLLADDSIVVAGTFQLSVDFDPSEGVDMRTAQGDYNPFVSKFDADGNYQWTRVFAGGSNAFSWAEAMAVDANDHLYVTGGYYSIVDFDPGPGVDQRTCAGCPGTGSDVYVIMLDASGNYLGTETFGGPSGNDTGKALAVDAQGKLFIVAEFVGTVDFDPGASEDLRTSVNGFNISLSKWNADGSYAWTHAYQAYNAHQPLATTAEGAVLLAGTFLDTVDFDPTEGVDLRIAQCHPEDCLGDAFVTKLNGDGSYGWASTFGALGGDVAFAVTVDGSDNIAVAGIFSETVDFDSGPDIDERTSLGHEDVFVTFLNVDGQTIWTRTLGGVGNDSVGSALEVLANGELLVVGGSSSAEDFDLGCAVVPPPDEVWSGLLLRLGCVEPAADGNGDSHTDLADLAAFQNCFSGPAPIVCPSGCYNFDFDSDDDFDLSDFTAFADTFKLP